MYPPRSVGAGVELRGLPAARLGVAGVHAEQVAGEKRRLFAAGAGADFQDHVAVLSALFGHGGALDGLAEARHVVAELGGFLARDLPQVGVGGLVGQNPFGFLQAQAGLLPGAVGFDDFGEAAAFLQQRGVELALRHDFGVNDLPLDLLELALHLFESVA